MWKVKEEGMEFQSLEEVVKMDLVDLNNLLFQRGGKKETIYLDKFCTEGTYYNLMANGKEIWFGPIEEINAIVKSLYRIAENPAKFDIVFRSFR